MSKLLNIVILLVLITSAVNAKASEAKKLCDAETKKEQPSRNILKKQCSIVAKEYIEEKKYSYAAWYYLLFGQHGKNIELLATHKVGLSNMAQGNIGHSYVLKREIKSAKDMYVQFLKNTSISWADKVMKEDYKLLFKLYPKQKETLEKGLALWNDLYQPLLKVNTLYPAYKKADKEKKYTEAIKYLTEVIEIQKKSGLQNEVTIADNQYNLGVEYNNNKEYAQSIKILRKVENIYTKEVNKDNIPKYLFAWLANSYEESKSYLKAIKYRKKSLIVYKEESDTENMIYAYSTLSQLYNKISNIEKAIYWKKMELEYSKNKGAILSSLATLYQENKDNKLAKDTYLKSIEEYKKEKNDKGVSIASFRLGQALEGLELYRESEEAFLVSLEANRRILGEDSKELLITYEQLANVTAEQAEKYFMKQKYKKAEKIYKKSYDFYKKSKKDNTALFAVCASFLGASMIENDKYISAETYLKEASKLVDLEGLHYDYKHFIITYYMISLSQQRKYEISVSPYKKLLRLTKSKFGDESNEVREIRKRYEDLKEKAVNAIIKNDMSLCMYDNSLLKGVMAYSDKKYKSSKEAFQKEEDKPYANWRLGGIYEKGLVGKKNNKRAFKYYQKAVEQYSEINNLQGYKAQYDLGKMYYYGRGTSPDIFKAFELFKIPCDFEHYNSCDYYNKILNSKAFKEEVKRKNFNYKNYERMVSVMLGGEVDLDACSFGRVSYSTTKGETPRRVEVKSGPDDKYKTITTLKDGTQVYGCDYNNGWGGIVYGESGCGVTHAIAKRQSYEGPCKQGWIPSSRYELIAD